VSGGRTFGAGNKVLAIVEASRESSLAAAPAPSAFLSDLSGDILSRVEFEEEVADLLGEMDETKLASVVLPLSSLS
jgi:hypothetical protein